MYDLLKTITGPSDVKKLGMEELNTLAGEMRQALIARLTTVGGHCGPNLGFVEAAVALHYVFDSPKDKMVYDVSHQTYPHKMLTGRQQGYTDPAHYADVSGFSNPDESAHDFFTIGHTSTSIGLAAGLAKARDLKGDKENIIAVIGDGSLSGGEALEALDYAGEQTTNFIVVLNDNEMSIAENHGGLYKNLKLLRETKGAAENNMFKAWGFDYIYVDEGNDIEKLIEGFKKAKDSDHPIVVHIHTLKGKGLPFAEKDPESYHAGGPFDEKTGEYKYKDSGESYGSLMGEYLEKKMKEDPKVIAINAATPTMFDFDKARRERVGVQFTDPGIAEECAAALASGIAVNGGKPVWGVFSTFMQRTFDQISQDICINKSPVTILVYGATAASMNDVNHLGIYDIPMISHIPELVYLAPANAEELFAMTEWSIEQTKYPVAIRVPAGVVHTDEKVDTDYSDLNRYKVVKKGEDIAIIALGGFLSLGEAAAAEIEKRTGKAPTLINPRYITGTDDELLESLKKDHSKVVTLEDGCISGGFGQMIAGFYSRSDMKVYNFGLKKEFLDRYDVQEVYKANRLTPEFIADDVL